MNKSIYAIFLIGFQSIVCSDDTSIEFAIIKGTPKTLPQEIVLKEEQIADFSNRYIDSENDSELEMPVYGCGTSMDQEKALFEQLRLIKNQKHFEFLNQNNEELTVEKLLPISFDLLAELGLPSDATVQEIQSKKRSLFEDTSKIPLPLQSIFSSEFTMLEYISQKNALPSQVSEPEYETAYNKFFGSKK